MVLLPMAQAMAQLTITGNVFGGGNQADVKVNTTVEIGGGTITGNVYGGGNLGDVGNIVKNTDNYNYIWTGNTVATSSTPARILSGQCQVTITGGQIGSTTLDADHGNVFGAGKGEDDPTFWCEKGMVYEAIVNISAGEVKRNVYGGGKIGRVENDTHVTIGNGAGTSGVDPTPTIDGNVFGAGAGIKTHGYSALVRGNSDVTVQGNAQVGKSVYGGGELATVGKYNIVTASNLDEISERYPEIEIGMPYETVSGGKCTVEVLGLAKIGPNASGHVFGGGKGYDPTDDTWTYDEEEATKKTSRPSRLTLKPTTIPSDFIYDTFEDETRVVREYFKDEAAYYVFLQTLALASNTDVTVKGSAEVNGSVYGGSESGFVQDHTNVKIQGDCKIKTTKDVANNDINGHVFGGGKGVQVFAEAGKVKGNTNVAISGGTAYGNVYGGGELGDVGTIVKNTTNYNYSWTGNLPADKTTNPVTPARILSGKCTVSITGSSATVKGNVFGAGKGSVSSFWCEKAMVYTTSVSIENGTIGTLNNSNVLVEKTGNVYGGGELGRVEYDTEVNIGVKPTGSTATTFNPTIYGNVFGAGGGVETHGYSALVRGDCYVTVANDAKVEHNVYGGGEKATAGRYWVKGVNDNVTGAPTAPDDLPDEMPYKTQRGGVCTVIIQDNAQVGPDTDANVSNSAGHVFGAGKGVTPAYFYDYNVNGSTNMADWSRRMVNYTPYNAATGKGHKDDDINKTWSYSDATYKYVWEYFTTKDKYFEFLQSLALATETHVTINGNASANIVKGNVYGGSESGFVQDDTDVKIQGGTIGTATYGHVFGGGRGLEEFAEAGKVKGNTEVAISAGNVKGNVYGGGELGDVGIIDKTDTDRETGKPTYNYAWKQTDGTTANTAEYNKITGASNNTGICKVTITGGTVGIENGTANHASGHVFGAGRGSSNTWWCEKAIVFATDVKVIGSTVVYGNVYGGGEVGRVEDDGKVTIGTANDTESGSKPDIKGDVFGAGAGLETHGYSALLRGNATVTVQGKAQVGGNVYGGGEIASVGKFEVVKGLPTKPKTGGTCIVNIKDNVQIGASDTDHNVFGACKGVTPHYDSSNHKSVYSMQTYENRPSENPDDSWDYYVTYAPGFTGQKFIKRYYTTEADYLAFLKTLALTSHPHVTIGGTWDETNGITPSGTPSVYGSVYGGGQRGVTLGNVDVNMVGGTVEQDVYGGGALADTNLGNWDVNGYVVATGITAGASSVTGLYTRTETDGKYTYTKITAEDATAENGTTYYRQEPTWAHDTGSAYYTTTVDLTGGTIKGDAYGGGLGQKTGFYDTQGNSATKDIEATVWGDINVNLGSSASGSSATSFYTTYVKDSYQTDVVNSGRVFGCNNLLGSPQGDVTVTVWRTVAGNGGAKVRTSAENKANNKTIMDNNPDNYESIPGYVPPTYEVAAVYGGGNLAPYTATGKKAHVVIHGCSDTSIETVYGGGNAARVPETDVDINSCYEIGTVFGGGNGRDMYKMGNEWKINPGANVGTFEQPGNANTMIYGGTVHKAYGGSNEKGTIYGDVVIDVGENQTGETCTLDVAQLVGAGKNADVNGNLKIIMGCKPNEKVPLVFGGADNANVNGDVELTVTSGNFGKVVGGNNAGGRIKGHIILNIEETTCIPLKIDHLYLCGNNAAYSQYGYYVKTTETEAGTGYGDSGEHAILSSGKLELIPRDSANDPHKPVDTYTYTYNEATSEAGATWTVLSSSFAGYAPPVLNVTSCTSIGEVFGGGYGATATVYGNPKVNINMIPGVHANKIDRDKDGNADGNANALGAIGDVYGGGDAAAVYGNTTVNIGTETTVQLHESISGEGVYTMSGPYDVTGAYITGNVYGGGKLANVGDYHEVTNGTTTTDEVDVEGSTFVNIGAVKGAEILDAQGNGTGKYNYTSVSFTAENAPGITIGGNVYGGGKGEALASGEGAFRCGKAMVTKHTYVAIGNGTIGDGDAAHGHVYGGGEKGRVQENTTVTIGCENDANSAPVITGNVFGAGKGVNTHGYSALTRGNSYVTIQGEAKVKMSVYGGGEIASVGKYNVNAQGLPESLANQNSGYCTVIVRDNAVIGPDAAMVMTAAGNPDDKGHVFGAGKGVLPYEGYADNAKAWRVKPTNEKQEYLSKNEAIAGTDESGYLPYVETLGLATQTYVTIDENAFVKGSVYGGSENGYVQHDTQVNIRGNCQIGNGYVQMADDGTYLATKFGVNRRYTAKEWEEGHLFVTGDTEVNASDPTEADLRTAVSTNYTSSLPECASWPYGQASGDAKYAPWDKYYGIEGYDSKGGRKTADDGHTFYGNVFGGGSGVIPYRPGKWHPEAGSVGGDTEVNISGGHILTNIYGGNELTDVYGKCTVNFSGTATLGVPRTLNQISAHPLTCYLFGAGKGDQRVLFNKKTNVKDVEVNITGGWIYGSVFGGGEDGHVHHNVIMNISDDTSETEHTNTKIGTWGTSYVDGNVFGGGRGFGADAYTAGNVAGTVTMNLLGGTILGSIFGGGRLGSVGYGLFDEGAEGYGEMRPDGEGEASNPTPATNFLRGHVYMTIGNNDGTGPTIGNTWEYKIPSADNGPMSDDPTPVPSLPADIKNWSAANWTTWKEYNHVPKTEYDTTTGRLTHTKGGNVFTGGMGNFYRQDGSTLISGVDWWKLGCVKSTTLTIKGGTIKSNVYGGGELGQVTGHHTTQNANYGTEITIQGSSTTIGTEIDDGSTVQYTFGSVFGGGYGSLMDKITVNGVTSNPKYIAGLVKEDTKIDMQNGAVKASIYGGGEMASVGESTTSGETTTATGSTHVAVSGGTVGIAPIDVSGTKRYFGGAKMGNVYGGGSGHNNTVRSGKIFKNSNVNISGSNTHIYHNVYGGGAYGTVGDFDYSEQDETVTVNGEQITVKKVNGVNSLKASDSGVATVTITGGTIGYDGKENGMVFGSSRGDINEPGKRDDHTAWVYDTNVTIGTVATGTPGQQGYVAESGPSIKGTVYGSGENGHVFHDTEVTINGGTIGIDDSEDPGYTVTSNGTTYSGAAYPYRGNVYGGGCGTDKYYSGSIPAGHTYNDGEGQLYNSLAGIVYGTSTINITGGHVVRNVYGAGAMGSVGKVTTNTEDGTISIPSGGTTTIAISGGTIGVDGNDNGNVFGAARGDKTTTQNNCALVKTTGVTISGSADIKGNVYGGGETGDVQGNTTVAVQGGTIAKNVFGGGKGSDNLFECSKAMVGIVNDGVEISGTGENPSDYTLLSGGTTVNMTNGRVKGNVYGGGEIARVERNTQVTIGAAEGTEEPIVEGNVFGAGAGLETHGYSALVRGTSTVTVQGKAQVWKNVYGGGAKASVGRYWVTTPANIEDDDFMEEHPGIRAGMPYGLKAGGKGTVIIKDNAVIGKDNDSNSGYVYGAGQGIEPRNYDYVDGEDGVDNYHIKDHKPGRIIMGDGWEYFDSPDEYLQFIETLAISAASDVTISGSATVKRSVFGGSESGFVYHDTDVKILGGEIGGNAFGGGKGLASFAEAGRVGWNTKLTMSNGTVKGNVYGGGNLGDVGTIDKTDKKDGQLTYNYFWKQTDGKTANTAEYNVPSGASHDTSKNTGICTVSITGGTIGSASGSTANHASGHVFGAGRGSSTTWWCEKAIVYATDVSVSGSALVYGTVYGGGEVGRVEDDGRVTIGEANDTDTESESKPDIRGDVFGAGAGLDTHGYSALLRGNAEVTVQGLAQVGGRVYGGGETASVGKFNVVGGLPTTPLSGGTCTVIVQDDAKIGSSGTDHHVFGACKGVEPAYDVEHYKNFKSMQTVGNGAKGTETEDWDYYDSEHRFVWKYYKTEEAYLAFLKTLALTSHTHVTIDENSTVNGSVYGGGERGVTLGRVEVNMNGGTVNKDLYGGGALADTNTGNWDAQTYVAENVSPGAPVTGLYTRSGAGTDVDPFVYTIIGEGVTAGSGNTYYHQGTWHDPVKTSRNYTTTVKLHGGTIVGSVYGGGLGRFAKGPVAADPENGVEAQAAVSAVEAKVYGDVFVTLNGVKPAENGSGSRGGEGSGSRRAPNAANNYDCVVQGIIFGCNNLNGSPQGSVTVHVFNTEGWTETKQVTDETGTQTVTVYHKKSDNKDGSTYDLTAVYGGGNLATFKPDLKATADTAKTYVIIDGCELTSIKQVFGGGNAASVPATEVVVNGTYEIGEVFGGGNGNTPYTIDGKTYLNPGANIGYTNYTTHTWNATTQQYEVTTNDNASTKEDRVRLYGYGIGKSHATIYGGTVHSVYGGSDTRGNVRVEARTTLDDLLECPFNVEDAYGGGHNAMMDGDAVLEIGCISGLGKAFGGAAAADVNGDVVLNITNGTYGQVFGGNDISGLIRGSITVNIEETGCKPIIIGELYGGGNLARYSVYGYNDDGSVKETGDNPVRDPQVNVKSFTSIGKIFGGGYGAGAKMVGNPYVNINVAKGKFKETVVSEDSRIIGSKVMKPGDTGYVATEGFEIPSHAANKIGAIGSVFGGGNAADVIGTPHVYIGTLTGEVISLVTKPIADSEGTDPTDEGWTSYELAKAEGVDIRGDVFGGGNAANVTGDTEVVIGKNNSVKTYSFTSYGESSGGEAWSSGLAQTTGNFVTLNDESKLAEVVILTNGKYSEYVGKKFYVNPEGTGRLQLYDANKAATSLWVDIKPFEHKTYTFTSYSAQTEGTQYSTGTAAPTGNFKVFSINDVNTECMQIVVLTNPGETSWVGKTFYVTTTGGSQRRQLYKATGEPVEVWVTIDNE